MADEALQVKSKKLIITPSDAQDPWDKDWNVALAKEPEKKIGIVNFRGEKELGTVPIYVELEEEYRNKGYGTECIGIMLAWLFHFKNVYEVKASTDRENDKAVKALKKNGFVLRGNEGREEHYSVIRQKTAWTGLYLFIGIFVGLIFGLVISHVIVGMIIGVVVGISIGLSLDTKANKERERVTGKSDMRG